MNAITIIIILIVLISLFVAISSLSAENKNHYNYPNPLSNYTSKILVDLEKCRVLTSETMSIPYEPKINFPLSSVLDPKAYDQDTKKSTFQSVIVFEKDGRKYYSNAVTMTKDTVEFFVVNKTTTIYYDPKKPDRYFFDISFLNDQELDSV